MDELSKQVFGDLPSGTFEIPQCGIYVKEESAAEPLLAYLRDRGYELEETEYDNWHARLRDDVLVRKGKCRHCGGYVDVLGIRAHGRDCELCGKPLCREFVDGGEMRISFADDRSFRNTFWMKVKRFEPTTDDRNKGEIVFYADPITTRGFFDLSLDDAKQKLIENEASIRRFEEDGVALIAIPYERGFVGVINTHDVNGRKYNADVVKLYDGKEYGEFLDRLPTPESITVYKAWNKEKFPLGPSETLHEAIIRAAGMVSRCDYYYQDGRPEFRDIHYLRMRIFVKELTTLDLDAWDAMTKRAPNSGPGFIRAAAAFCQGTKQPVVKDDPNIGNLIVGLDKVFGGEALTEDEAVAMLRAVDDPQTFGNFADVFKR